MNVSKFGKKKHNKKKMKFVDLFPIKREIR